VLRDTEFTELPFYECRGKASVLPALPFCHGDKSPVDEEPLFSIVAKQMTMFAYEVSCLKCKTRYRGMFGKVAEE
jgi:hypothetical protein